MVSLGSPPGAPYATHKYVNFPAFGTTPSEASPNTSIKLATLERRRRREEEKKRRQKENRNRENTGER